MTSILEYQKNKNKQTKSNIANSCAGIGCPNEGIYLLNVAFLNKSGLFCDDCKYELMNLGLVFESKNGNGRGVSPPTKANADVYKPDYDNPRANQELS